jgi:putative cardiolipin synthase
VAALGVALLALALGGCRSLAPNPDRVVTRAAPPAATGALAEVTNDLRDRHGPNRDTFLPVDVNREALEWRLALVDSAEETIDAMYFIWHGASGTLLTDRLVKAADRGVRVRLLIDDLLLADHDRGAALLDLHPNIELRVYNPWTSRDGGWLTRALEGVMRFEEVNHRMHNKLLVADNHLAVVGGRNVGDAYYGLSDAYNFRDFDVVAAGPCVPALSKSFDEYWNSPVSYPAEDMVPNLDADDLSEVYERIARGLEKKRERLASFPLEPIDWGPQLETLRDRMIVGAAHVAYDEAADEDHERDARMIHELRAMLRSAEEEVLICTPYLIVADDPLVRTREAVERGIAVRVLTNSLASYDREITYSGYRKDRRDILETGLELYELREDAASHTISDTAPVEASRLSLHSKLIVVDRALLYVGTYNIDPRSKRINSEMGLIIHSPPLARAVAALIERDMGPDNAWRVRLDEDGRTSWESSAGVTHQAPSRGIEQNVADFFFGLLPIEDQL